jgi:putative sterol carrier protein
VARYLSQEWFEDMRAAATAFASDAGERRVSLREVITGTPFDDVSYVMTIDDGALDISLDEAAEADVTFTQSYDTAVALHKGDLTTHDAFFAGRVRVAGKLNALLDNADLLQGIAPVFADVRAATTY